MYQPATDLRLGLVNRQVPVDPLRRTEAEMDLGRGAGRQGIELVEDSLGGEVMLGGEPS